MSKENKVLSVHKNTQGDVVLEFNPQNITFVAVIKIILSSFLKIFLPIFAFFDFLATKKKLVISGAGLGIGLGLSVLVTQHPDTLQAFPTIVGDSNTPIVAQQIVISSIDLSSFVVSGSVQDIFKSPGSGLLIHDERSSELGGNYPVVIAEVGLQNILSNLDNVQIGDTVIVRGSNAADYKYAVTEIRDMKAEYLPNVIGANSDSVIIYKAKNFLRTQLFMVIAKPIK